MAPKPAQHPGPAWLPWGMPRVVDGPAAGQSGQILTGIGLITAIIAPNGNTTTYSKVTLYDGTDTTGLVLANLFAPASGNCNICPGYPGIPFRNGIYLHSAFGGIVVTLVYIPVANPPE